MTFSTITAGTAQQSASNTNTDRISVSLAVTAGDRVFVAFAGRKATPAPALSSFSDDGGNTWSAPNTNMSAAFPAGSTTTRLIVRTAVAAATGTITITGVWTGTALANAMVAFVDGPLDSANPFPTASVQQNNSGTTASSGTHGALTHEANRRLLFIAHEAGAGDVARESTSWDEVADVLCSDGLGLAVYQTNSDTDDTTPSATLPSSVNYRATSIELANGIHASGGVAIAVTLSGTGAETFSGSGSPALLPTLSGTGTVTNPGVSGTGALAVVLSLAGTGTELVTGTGDLAVLLALSGAGAELETGTGAMAMALSLSGAGQVGNGVNGSGGLTVALSQAGTGTETITGSGGLNVALALSGAGTETFAGTGALAVQLSLAGTATEAFAGTGGLSVSLALSATGAESIPGAGAMAMGPGLSGSGTVTTPASGTGNMVVALVMNGAGSVPVTTTVTGKYAPERQSVYDTIGALGDFAAIAASARADVEAAGV